MDVKQVLSRNQGMLVIKMSPPIDAKGHELFFYDWRKFARICGEEIYPPVFDHALVIERSAIDLIP